MKQKNNSEYNNVDAMFTIRKLKSLPKKLRLRKIILILQEIELKIYHQKEIDLSYLENILSLLEEYKLSKSHFKLENIDLKNKNKIFLKRYLNTIRYSVLSFLGAEPAEWDFVSPVTELLDASSRKVFPARIFLEDLRSPFNVGSIVRTAESFGVSHIFLTDYTPPLDHKKVQKTSRGCFKIIPWSVAALEEIKGEKGIFALETGGQPVSDFVFPEKGIALIGSEELGLSPEALKLADKGFGRVSIPLAGAKRSLNVSVAFGIMMFKWYSFIQGKNK